MGRPWLFKWVLQHKELYSGVLYGLGNDDDDEYFIYVLSTLKERVLMEESLVPLGLWTFGFIVSQSHDPALFDSEDVESIMECLYPCPFSWSLMNKGLLYSDFLVKHATLKTSFRGIEVAGLDSFIGALNRGSYSSNQMMQGWAALKQGIQNEVRTLNFV